MAVDELIERELPSVLETKDQLAELYSAWT